MILICITPPMSHTPLTLQVPPVRALTVWVTQLSSSEGDLDEMVQRLQRELVDGSGDLFVQVSLIKFICPRFQVLNSVPMRKRGIR